MHNIVIKLNNAATNDPCAICGKRTDPQVGPELFLEGTWSPVCHECGMKYAQPLVILVGDVNELYGVNPLEAERHGSNVLPFPGADDDPDLPLGEDIDR